MQNRMTISQRFNGFYHAILSEAFDNTMSISFREWKDANGRGCLIFYKGDETDGADYDCVACPKGTPFERDTSLKTIFKNMNTDYGMEGDKKISTTDIDTKALCRHIEFVTKILNENGITFEHDEEEWKRLLEDAGIEHKGAYYELRN